MPLPILVNNIILHTYYLVSQIIYQSFAVDGGVSV